ncbi:MAG TPA: hypothetical protein PKW42_04460, partial [bacterium]|nr:hypothetical protein [bacterium]
MKKNLLIVGMVFFSVSLKAANFSVSPEVFSPAISPGRNDAVIIGGTMEETLPVNVYIYPKGLPASIIKKIPYSEFNGSQGSIDNRGGWDGKDTQGQIVSDGEYEIQLSSGLNKIWSAGNPRGDMRGMFDFPVDVAIGNDGRIYVLDTNRIQVFDEERN